MKLVELAVFGQDTTYRARYRTHHQGLGFDYILAEFDAAEHWPGCDACRREEAVASDHVLDLVFFLRILDAHLRGSRPQLLGVDNEPCLHLSADTAQSRSREHTFWRATNAQINIDTGPRVRAVDDAGHVAVADQADCGARLSHGGYDIGVTWAIEQDRRDFRRLHTLGFCQRQNVFRRRRVKIDRALGIARTDRDLVHVAVWRMQQGPGVCHCQCRDGAGHVLGTKRRAFKWIDRDVDLRSGFGADFFPDEQHRGLIHLALTDHDRAVDGQLVKFAPHGIDSRLIRGFVFAVSAQAGRRNSRTLRDTHNLEAENAFQQQFRLDGNTRHMTFPSQTLGRAQFFSILMTCG